MNILCKIAGHKWKTKISTTRIKKQNNLTAKLTGEKFTCQRCNTQKIEGKIEVKNDNLPKKQI